MKGKAIVESFLQGYRAAPSSVDLDDIASCWEVPALALSDERAIAVDTEKQIQDFFAETVKAYHQQGLKSTQPVSVASTNSVLASSALM